MSRPGGEEEDGDAYLMATPIASAGAALKEQENSLFRVIGYEKSPIGDLNDFQRPLLTTETKALELGRCITKRIDNDEGAGPAEEHDVTTSVVRVDVGLGPDVFMLHNVLSPEECRKLINLTEEMGYTHWLNLDTCLWVPHEELVSEVFDRMVDFLPSSVQSIDLGKPCGLNARWRVYRYDRDDEFEQHYDGSYPGSIVGSNGYVTDGYGDRWSQLTLLLYLNADFEGGSTTFYPENDPKVPKTTGVPGESKPVPVKPVCGAAMLFPQQGHEFNRWKQYSPLHSGDIITQGKKYVIRSDVLYKVPES